MPLFGASRRVANAVNAAAIVVGLIWSARPDRQTFKVVSTALPFLLKDILVIFWLCFKMGACLFVAELASTALAAGWLGVRGLGGRAQAAGQLGASGASGVVHKNWRKGKPIQPRGRDGVGGGRKAASLLENCGSSKA